MRSASNVLRVSTSPRLAYNSARQAESPPGKVAQERYPVGAPFLRATVTSYLREGAEKNRHCTQSRSRTVQNVQSDLQCSQMWSKVESASRACSGTMSPAGRNRARRTAFHTEPSIFARFNAGSRLNRASMASGRSGRTSHWNGNNSRQPNAWVRRPQFSFGSPMTNAAPAERQLE